MLRLWSTHETLKRAFVKSHAGRLLSVVTVAVIALTIALPFTPLAGLMGFVPLPASFFLILGAIVICYILSAEVVKKLFYRRAATSGRAEA